MTTYQEVWNLFKAIGRVNATDLPSSDSGRYALINASRMFYNENLEVIRDDYVELLQDDNLEEFNQVLGDRYKELFAECMKLITVKNMTSQFISDSQIYQSSMGVRDYRSQIASRELQVTMQENRIDELLNKIADSLES